MSRHCECDSWAQVLRCCRNIASSAQELERLLEPLTPSANILLLEDSASKLFARGVKVTIQNLVAVGVPASIFQDVAVKKRLLDLKHKYNTPPRHTSATAPAAATTPAPEPAVIRTDETGYLLSGIQDVFREPS